MVSTEVVKEFGVFKGLDDSELAKIAELCHERTLDEAAPLFTQGNRATELHLCRSGGVDIIVQLREPWGIYENPHIGYILMRNLSAVISSRLREYRQKLAVEIAATIHKEW